MAQTEADKTFTQAKTSKGTKGPVFVGGSTRKKKKPKIDVASEQAKLREAQEKVAVGDIRRREQEALLGLERQEAEIAPKFTEARRATTAGSELAGQRFREGIAGQGLTGAGSEARIRQTGALQRDIGGLRQQEAEQFSDIARTRADIGRAAESDIASTKAGIQAQSIQDLINLRNQERQQELQEAQLTGMFRGEQTLAGQQATEQSALRGLQTEAARLGLQESQLQNLVNQNMGDLMAAMQQYPVGSKEYNALRVARETKIRQQEQSTRELEDRELERRIMEEELNLAQQRERRLGAPTGGGTTTTKLPTGYTSIFNNFVDSAIKAKQKFDSLGDPIPLTTQELAEIRQFAQQQTDATFGINQQPAPRITAEGLQNLQGLGTGALPFGLGALFGVGDARTTTQQPIGTATEASDIRSRLGLNR